jgi:hypothetical protein
VKDRVARGASSVSSRRLRSSIRMRSTGSRRPSATPTKT